MVLMIDRLLYVLPEKYHKLMKAGVRPKFEVNSHNKSLISTLMAADYISSSKIEGEKILTFTKIKK